MKTGLDLKNITSPSTTVDRSTARAPVAGTGTTAPTQATQRVELSDQAVRLGNSGVSSEFDAEKVDRIKNAIRNGEFKVDASVIADKLIRHATELIGGTAH